MEEINIKEYLEQARTINRLNQLYENILKSYDYEDVNLLGYSDSKTGVPGSKTKYQKSVVETAVIKSNERIKMFKKKIENNRKILNEIEGVIKEEIKEEEIRILFLRRYIDNQPWKVISIELDKKIQSLIKLRNDNFNKMKVPESQKDRPLIE